MCYKLSEGYADVYYGIEQRYERLDYAGNSMMIRGVGAVVLFVAGYLLSDSLSVCIVLMTVFSFLVVFFYDRRKTSCWLQQEWGVEIPKNAVKSLLVTCIPLAVVAFLNNLSSNLPKMGLERFFGSALMGRRQWWFSLRRRPYLLPLFRDLRSVFRMGTKQAFGVLSAVSY